MNPSDIFVIVNPTAGGRRGRRVWPGIRMALQSAGVRLVEAVAEGPRHAWGLAERVHGLGMG